MILPALVRASTTAIAALSLLVTGCAATAAPEKSSPLSPVLERYADWHGESGAIEALTFISYDFELWDKGKTYLVRFAGTPAGLIRVDAYGEGKHLVSEGIDEQGGWTWRPGQPAPEAASPQGAAALRHGQAFNVLFLNQLPSRGHRIEPSDETVAAGEISLRVTLSDGFESRLFLDRQTGRLLRKKDRSSLHPDIDPSQQWFETSFSDYKTLNGVKLWTRSQTRDVATGQVVQRMVRKDFAFAPPAADYFDRNRKAAPQLPARLK